MMNDPDDHRVASWACACASASASASASVAAAAADAARIMSQEARLLLTSLRGGPPIVARGELASNVYELRTRLIDLMEHLRIQILAVNYNSSNDDGNIHNSSLQQQQDCQYPLEQRISTLLRQVGDPSLPFLAVIQDPRAAGPHTLVALRAIKTLLPVFVNEDINNCVFGVPLQPLINGVLACQFEQTDAALDEAVEMALADVLGVLIRMTTTASQSQMKATASSPSSTSKNHGVVEPAVILNAVSTVFVTRVNFAAQHLPALCYALDQVLVDMITALFSSSSSTTSSSSSSNHYPIPSTKGLILQFLISQFLPCTTPSYSRSSTSSSSSSSISAACVVSSASRQSPRSASTSTTTTNLLLDPEAMREAALVLDATRIVCLRLIRTALLSNHNHNCNNAESRIVRRFIQDDLCFALLRTGQLMWAGTSSTAHHHHTIISNNMSHNHNNHKSLSSALSAADNSFVSLELLHEITCTIQFLWNSPRPSSPPLLDQDQDQDHDHPLLWYPPLHDPITMSTSFQAIWTGLYTRTLVLLRKRRMPHNPTYYHANLLFDEQAEIILESLIDMICLHMSSGSSSNGGGGGGGGTLETLFVLYDCHLHRNDVATDLFVELCRCCGGTVNEDGDVVLATLTPSSSFLDLEELATVHDSNTSTNDTNILHAPGSSAENTATIAAAATTPSTPLQPPLASSTSASSAAYAATTSPSSLSTPGLLVEHPMRPVPPHLIELCAQALMGAMKCLFCDDQPSNETLQLRATRKHSILKLSSSSSSSGTTTRASTSSSPSPPPSLHCLRDLKATKRLLRKAARIFNHKASQGIEFLHDAGLAPQPVAPANVAHFLRNGLVVGLDKKAVGAYLGEAGKAPMAGKSPPDWERDWFHKDVLKQYCDLFHFEHQSLLEGLRMFLAAFRLPGEAQQIDRILQAFADSCGQVCDESSAGRMKLFSDDPKRASDTAYLLSFSIIMLNTDRHNANIRDDRKMSLDDFVKNNTDYGRDITEPGKEIPREYLQSIYDSINQEQIRTENEGAEGDMTIERWKDVLRGSTSSDSILSAAVTTTSTAATSDSVQHYPRSYHPSLHDAEDLTELILEHVWRPIVSALGALWGVRVDKTGGSLSLMQISAVASESGQYSGMLGSQGARLGMDLAVEMLNGVRALGRVDIFRKIFLWVCDYSGLLGDNHSSDSFARSWVFTNSVEAQSAVVVALTTALEAGEYLDEEGWRRLWLILFELRDLKLIPCRGSGGGSGKSILTESDPDFLTLSARHEWTICLVKDDMNYVAGKTKAAKKSVSLLGAFGRALFGTESSEDSNRNSYNGFNEDNTMSLRGKQGMVVWNDFASSDDDEEEDDDNVYDDDDDMTDEEPQTEHDESDDFYRLSPGSKFEALLIKESVDFDKKKNMPVTGLERVEETRRYKTSPRARVRERFRLLINFQGIVSDSRFLDENGVTVMLQSLVAVVNSACRMSSKGTTDAASARKEFDRSLSDCSSSSFTGFTGIATTRPIVSPASEAFAEILICEIALRNKDRLKTIWNSVLQDHYIGRLTSIMVSQQPYPHGLGDDCGDVSKIPANPGLEKRITGLFRLSACALKREEVASDVMSCWRFVLPMNAEQLATSPLRVLDRHFGEGLWRIVCETESLHHLNEQGWEGLASLLTWGAKVGFASSIPINYSKTSGEQFHGRLTLSDDDPTLQTYRSVHLLLTSGDMPLRVPFSIVECLQILVQVGERRQYSQLSIASVDLMHQLLDQRLTQLWADPQQHPQHVQANKNMTDFWSGWWRRIVESIAEVAELSSDTNVRQHVLSVLTDIFLDKSGRIVPTHHWTRVLSEVCVPLAGRRITKLQQLRENDDDGDDESLRRTQHNKKSHQQQQQSTREDEMMIEFELCVGLVFKPIRHHLSYYYRQHHHHYDDSSNFIECDADAILPLWKSILSALDELLCENQKHPRQSSSSSSSGDSDAPHTTERRSRSRAMMLPQSQSPSLAQSRSTMKNLALEHLQSATQVLLSSGVLRLLDNDENDNNNNDNNQKVGDSIQDENDNDSRGVDKDPRPSPSSSAVAMIRLTVHSLARMGISSTTLREWQKQCQAAAADACNVDRNDPSSIIAL